MFEIQINNAQEISAYPEKVKRAVLANLQSGMLDAMIDLANFTADAAPVMTGQMADKIRNSYTVEQGPTLLTGRLGQDMWKSASIAIWNAQGTHNEAFDIRDKYGRAVANDNARAKGKKVRSSLTAWGPTAVMQALMIPGGAHPFFKRSEFDVAGDNFLTQSLDARKDAILQILRDRITEALTMTAAQ